MKSKLFLSLSLLTAVFSMNANIGSRSFSGPSGQKMLTLLNAREATINSFKKPINTTIETLANSAAQSPVGKFCSTNASAATVTSVASSRIAQFAAHPTTQYAAGALAVSGLGLATCAGLNKLANYMHPEAVTPTRFERVKAQVQKGYNSSLTFVKANQKPVGAVAAVAALGLLGYKMYQNKEAIFGKSQAVQANTVQAEEKPVVHIFRQRARD